MKSGFEFVESKVFSKQIGELPSRLLTNIQSDLIQDPERGAVVKGTHGVRKARIAVQLRLAERAGVTDTSIFILNTPAGFICCTSSAKGNKPICRRSKSALWER